MGVTGTPVCLDEVLSISYKNAKSTFWTERNPVMNGNSLGA